MFVSTFEEKSSWNCLQINADKLTLKVLNFWKFTSYFSLKPLWSGHGGNSAGSYLANATSPIPSHCTSIVVTSTVRVNFWNLCGVPTITDNNLNSFFLQLHTVKLKSNMFLEPQQMVEYSNKEQSYTNFLNLLFLRLFADLFHIEEHRQNTQVMFLRNVYRPTVSFVHYFLMVVICVTTEKCNVHRPACSGNKKARGL